MAAAVLEIVDNAAQLREQIAAAKGKLDSATERRDEAAAFLAKMMAQLETERKRYAAAEQKHIELTAISFRSEVSQLALSNATVGAMHSQRAITSIQLLIGQKKNELQILDREHLRARTDFELFTAMLETGRLRTARDIADREHTAAAALAEEKFSKLQKETAAYSGHLELIERLRIQSAKAK